MPPYAGEVETPPKAVFAGDPKDRKDFDAFVKCATDDPHTMIEVLAQMGNTLGDTTGMYQLEVREFRARQRAHAAASAILHLVDHMKFDEGTQADIEEARGACPIRTAQKAWDTLATSRKKTPGESTYELSSRGATGDGASKQITTRREQLQPLVAYTMRVAGAQQWLY